MLLCTSIIAATQRMLHAKRELLNVASSCNNLANHSGWCHSQDTDSSKFEHDIWNLYILLGRVLGRDL